VSRLEKVPENHRLYFSYILDNLKSHQNKYAYISDETGIAIFAYFSIRKGIEDLHVADEKKYLVPFSYVASKSLEINLFNKINSM
jgi:hypothetical protein